MSSRDAAAMSARTPSRGGSATAGVTQVDVAKTALRIAGEKSLDAVSIRSVAGELGISPMTIYRFVASKEDLLDAMLIEAMGRMEIPYSRRVDWDERIVELMLVWRELLLEHPSVTQILVDRRVPAGSPGLGRLAEHVLAALEDAGLTEKSAARAFWQIFSLTFGHIVFESPRRSIDVAAQAEAGRAMEATGKAHGFERVERLAADLTNIAARGSLADALRALLRGIAAQPREAGDRTA